MGGIRTKFAVGDNQRAFDNIFTERLWRSVKYEEVYLKDYGQVDEARRGLGGYFGFYNHDRPHQSLGYQTPAEVHFAGRGSRDPLEPRGVLPRTIRNGRTKTCGEIRGWAILGRNPGERSDDHGVAVMARLFRRGNIEAREASRI
jgi:hypothetical protein